MIRDGIGPALLGIIICVALVSGLTVWAVVQPGREHQISSYTTSLAGRTPSQIHNLMRAANRIDGLVLQPGEVFSFIKTVGPWTADMGYVKAPVSYNGDLINDWGGGVCQTSSTLYNAALLAGLKIIERHRHHWPARYAPIGRDAAVACYNIDLKFENTLSSPVRISCKVVGDKVVSRLFSAAQLEYNVRVETRAASVTKPAQILLPGEMSGGRLKLVNRGHPGFHVRTYRCIEYRDGLKRELISDDNYPVMNRVVRMVTK